MMTSSGWKKLIETEAAKPYMHQLKQHLLNDYNSRTVYPKHTDILKALELTPFEAVKVVILGQDPYHGPGQAHGLSFSVPNGVKIPPSLLNIFKELSDDLNITRPNQTDLTPWAKQGVLLLNTTLTVLSGSPMSHANLGWETFTDEILSCLNNNKENLVFVLWGAHAQKKIKLINTTKHLIIKSPHPSPLSAHRGFFGSKPFSKTNTHLISKGMPPINWAL
ncbi:MAG: uracil-DNA glycosylase [Defluviitaleaceae bacterium]|nr:uracil-DNA glycosylase [Defluviitaleaceae bacterium]